jgi:predicted DsbA family dithiol-disulfide isomerase
MAAASGRDIVFNTEWMPNTRRALEASEYAREQGRHEEFHRAVFQRFYGEGQDIEDWDVLAGAAREVDLDPDAMQEATESGQYAAVVDEHIRNAHAVGITGVPAYVLGNRYLIMGAQPYEVFQQVMAELDASRTDEES